MDLNLTPRQDQLKSDVRQLVSSICPPEVAKEWDDTETVPAPLLDAITQHGLFKLALPDLDRHDNTSTTDLTIVTEQLGHSSLDVALTFSGRLIPGLSILQWGTDEQQEAVKSALVNGDRNYATGISEPEAGSDAAALTTTAASRGHDYRIDGTKLWCTGAGVKDTSILLYARTNPTEAKHKGLSAFIVDPGATGVTLRRIPTLARRMLGTFEVSLDNVVVSRDSLVGEVDKGWQVMLSNLELDRIMLSGGYVGAAQSTLDIAIEYAKRRHQFDRPIGTFQALAHAIADLQTDIDCARLLTYRAAWLRDQSVPCPREAAMAKLKGSETYVNTARWGMQIMAAYGFASESVMSHRYREAIVATTSGGTSQVQRNAIARDLGFKTY